MSLAQFGALIEGTFATGTYTVTRRAPTTTGTDGRAVTGASSPLTITASVQALGGKDLQQLTEAQMTGERRTLWTTTRLQTLQSDGAPDHVTIDGASWIVETVEDWNVLGGFYKCIVVREGNF